MISPKPLLPVWFSTHTHILTYSSLPHFHTSTLPHRLSRRAHPAHPRHLHRDLIVIGAVLHRGVPVVGADDGPGQVEGRAFDPAAAMRLGQSETHRFGRPLPLGRQAGLPGWQGV